MAFRRRPKGSIKSKGYSKPIGPEKQKVYGERIIGPEAPKSPIKPKPVPSVPPPSRAPHAGTLGTRAPGETRGNASAADQRKRELMREYAEKRAAQRKLFLAGGTISDGRKAGPSTPPGTYESGGKLVRPNAPKPSKIVVPKRGRKVGQKNKEQKRKPDRFFTYFKAQGKSGDLNTPEFLKQGGFDPSGSPEGSRAIRLYYVKHGIEAPPGYISGPVSFFSNQGLVPVKQTGLVTLKECIERLNRALNIKTRKGRVADFREVYREWSFKYQVTRDSDDGTRDKYGSVEYNTKVLTPQKGAYKGRYSRSELQKRKTAAHRATMKKYDAKTGQLKKTRKGRKK